MNGTREREGALANVTRADVRTDPRVTGRPTARGDRKCYSAGHGVQLDTERCPDGLHVSRYPVPSPLRHCSCCGEKSSALHWSRSNARYADAEPQSGAGCHYLLPCEPEAVMRNPSFVLNTTRSRSSLKSFQPQTHTHAHAL